MTALRVCPTCGEKIQPSLGECLYCSAVEMAEFSEPAPVAPTSPEPPRPANPDHAFGLLLFEAEECLARGQADKATVLASRAVKERPGNLTARAVLERSRRELLQGRRREKLEARVQEAQGLLARGELDSANRIVTSALKLIPDHAVALALFGRIKERRHATGTAEAEAERELERLSRLQAKQALAAARAALDAGWERRALGALRRGLRMVPDDAELLALLKEVQNAGDLLDRETARRRAVHPQIRAGLEMLSHGQVEESLRVLRAVLKDDPDNGRAQSAIQEVRKAWLARASGPAAPPASAPSPPTPPAGASMPAPAPMPVRPTPARLAPPADDPLPRRPTGSGHRTVYSSGPRRIPGEILLPRTRRRATPMRLILIGGAILFAVIAALFVSSRAPSPAPGTPPRAAPTAAAPVVTAPPVEDRGPMARIDPALRLAIEDTLSGYQRALETQDAALLARFRPDLAPEVRERRLSRLGGALNIGIDLRVLDVEVTPPEAVVPILRTEVVVGGRGGESPPEEETLRFEHRPEGWVLGARRD